jgi:branched-chain amino acid transport system permease protein
VFPVVVIGGLESIPATLVAAILLGILERLVAGYLDPVIGAGFSTIAPFLVLIATLVVRPHGLLGTPSIKRI